MLLLQLQTRFVTVYLHNQSYIIHMSREDPFVTKMSLTEAPHEATPLEADIAAVLADLDAEQSPCAEMIRSMTADQIAAFDAKYMNLNGLVWGMFRTVEDEDVPRLKDAIDRWFGAAGSEQKTIGVEIKKILQ